MKNKKQDNPREMNLPCGYCRSKDHQFCPGAVRNGVGVIWTCPCGCDNSKRVRCLTCKTELLDPVAQQGWNCLDKDACARSIQQRLEQDPTITKIRESQQRAQKPRQDTTPKATKKAPSCLCGGGDTTEGAQFLPGDNARYLTKLPEMDDRQQAHKLAAAVSSAFYDKFSSRAGGY